MAQSLTFGMGQILSREISDLAIAHDHMFAAKHGELLITSRYVAGRPETNCLRAHSQNMHGVLRIRTWQEDLKQTDLHAH